MAGSKINFRGPSGSKNETVFRLARRDGFRARKRRKCEASPFSVSPGESENGLVFAAPEVAQTAAPGTHFQFEFVVPSSGLWRAQGSPGGGAARGHRTSCPSPNVELDNVRKGWGDSLAEPHSGGRALLRAFGGRWL